MNAQHPDDARGAVVLLFHRPPRRFYTDASTVMEHVHAFARHSRFSVFEVNTEYGFPAGLERIQPGAVVLHYSLFGPGLHLLSPRFLEWLSRSDAYKICFFQDENRYCRWRFGFLDEHRIDCVFTHLAPEYFEQVYGKHTRVPRLEFNVPGYVSEELLEAATRHARPESKRTVDVGYRGRPLPAYMGRGSQEKVEIGIRFAMRARDLDMSLDIDTSEGGRLYGQAWYEFIASCRTVLGVESGVSLFDLEDEVRHEYEALLAGGRQPTLDDLERGALGRWDGRIPYRTISPRHFEAAALRTCQVMFEGSYSGAMQPMVHYIPLRKDFSNFDEVVERIRDTELRHTLVENAHRDLIASGNWSYGRLISQVDGVLADAELTPASVPAVASALARGAGRRKLVTHARWLPRAKLRPFMEWIAPFTGRVRDLIGHPRPVPPV